MEAEGYIVRVIQDDRVLHEAGIVLPAVVGITIIELPAGMGYAGLEIGKIEIEKVGPEPEDAEVKPNPDDY